MEASRELFWNIGLGPYILYPLSAIAVGILIYAIYRRIRLWQLGKPDNRSDNLGQRIKYFIGLGIIDGLLHRRIFGIAPRTRSPRELYPGIMHILIFWGCLVFLLGTFLDALSHYVVEFMHGGFYLGTSLALDIASVLVLIGVLIAAFRRYVQKPDRLDNKAEDAIALALIFTVVLSGLFLEGFRIATATPEGIAEPVIFSHPEWAKWSPAGYALANLFKGLAESTREAWYAGLWWFHMALVLGATVYISLYFSKLSHILVSPLNIFFRSLRPKGALVPVDLETAETFGVNKIEDFTWKQLLDLDACTRCGRCQDNCPAYLSGAPLSPKKVIQDLKTGLIGKGFLFGTRKREGNPESSPLIGELVTEEELWACTTCRACQETCPVFVEHIDKIVDMRRHLVLEQAKVPETIESILRCIETRGHSCRGTTFTRTDWTEGLEIKVLSEDSNIDTLYWVSCAAALEDRNIKVAIAFANVLKTAGVNFGILGVEETCCGEPARRIGNEYLFQIQAQRNIEILKNYNVKRIVTTCPHCFNTLKNEYPQFGGEFEVIHHAEFLAQLLEEGRLKLAKALNQSITYQDPCYLGRHNDIYEAPREVLREISGAKPVEMARHRQNSFCCGGGGGHFWMEEQAGRRIKAVRTEQIIETEAGIVANACPYCLQMFEDGIKAKEKEESLKAMDIAELVISATSPGP